jgi:hypothetical protein
MSCHGHVDQITRERLGGWAADLAAPDEVIDVIILLNGNQIARIPCDRPRADLAEIPATFGSGRHGFLYEFSPPLGDGRDWGIAIRFADSGQSLPRGDAVLQQGKESFSTATASSLVLPAPTDPPSLFRLLALHEERSGLDGLLCRIDFRGVGRSDLERSVFGIRGPASTPSGEWTEPTARDYLNQLLSSPEFQENVVAHALRAFPEKRRIVFIHIPKCAGTGLALHLARRFPLVPASWQSEQWTSRDQLFVNLGRFVRETAFSDTVAAVGHLPLSCYADQDLLRPGDRVFTIVRHPLAIAVSALNYMFTRMAEDAREEIRPDVAEWMGALDLKALAAAVTPEFVAEIAPRALRTPQIVQANPLCYWLGGGSVGEVIERLARYRVEITTTTRYDAWLAGEWNVTHSPRDNESTKYLSLNDLGDADKEFLAGISGEDLELYGLISRYLQESGTASIFGDELAQPAQPSRVRQRRSAAGGDAGDEVADVR